jgi:hypothetical protein
VGVPKGDAGGEHQPLASAQVASLALDLLAGWRQLRAAAATGRLSDAVNGYPDRWPGSGGR